MISTEQVLTIALKRANLKHDQKRGTTLDKDRMTQAEMDQTWDALGALVAKYLNSARALRIEGFGLFSLDRKGQPVFLLAQDFVNRHNVSQEQPGVPGDLAASKVNLARLARDAGVARPRAEAALGAALAAAGRLVDQERAFELAFAPAAAFRYTGRRGGGGGGGGGTGPGRCRMVFDEGFLRDLAALRREAQRASTPGGYSRADGDQPLERRMQSLGTQRGRGQQGRGQQGRGRGQGGRPGRGAAAAAATGGRRRPEVAGVPSAPHPDGDLITYWNEGRRTQSPPRRDFVAENRRKYGAAAAAAAPPPADVPPPPPPGSLPSSSRAPGTPDFLRGAVPPRRGPTTPPFAVDPPPKRFETSAAEYAKLPILERVRLKIQERGVHGLKSLTRAFQIMDDNNDGRLSKNEWRNGLRDYGLEFSEEELGQAFRHFDKDGDGAIELEELLEAVAPRLSDRRRALVDEVFGLLDRNSDGVLTLADLQDLYKVEEAPEFKNGEMTKAQVLNTFLSQWDSRNDPDDEITLEEFRDYYQRIGLNIEDEDYFELMLRNAWHLPGGRGAAENTANRRGPVRRDGQEVVDYTERGFLVTPSRETPGAVRARLVAAQARARREEDAASVVSAAGSRRSAVEGEAGGSSSWAGRSSSGWGADPHAAVAAGAWAHAARDPLARLARLLFNPPKSLEDFTRDSLRASTTQENVSISTGHLARRLQQLDKRLSKMEATEIARAADPNNSTMVDVQWLHEELSSRFGKPAVETRPKTVVEMVQRKIIEAGGDAGVKKLARIFGITPTETEVQVTKMQLKEGLQQFGILINTRAIDDLMTVYDADKSGRVTWGELVAGVRPPLPPRRALAVRAAFDLLDKDKTGRVGVERLCQRYDLRYHPGVMNGTLANEDEALKGFRRRWRGQREVTCQDFLDYYQDMSIHIDGDDFFEETIRRAWRIHNDDVVPGTPGSIHSREFRSPPGSGGAAASGGGRGGGGGGSLGASPESSGGRGLLTPPRGGTPASARSAGRGGDLSGGGAGGVPRGASARARGQRYMAGGSMRALLADDEEEEAGGASPPRPPTAASAGAASVYQGRDAAVAARARGALALQRLFRGHLGRKRAGRRRRARAAAERERLATAAAAARPRPKHASVTRAHLKTTYGF